jgi:3-oxoacyl-[acyl-carrier-protein] synthase II
MRRVVITGFGAITSIGHDWPSFRASIEQGKNGVVRMDEWDRYDKLNTRLGGPVLDFELPPSFERKKTRGMGRVALLATAATEKALRDANLLDNESIKDGRMGVSYGSSTGSTDAIGAFAKMRMESDMSMINGTSYIQMMSHTAAANIGLFFQLKGRIIPTCSACTSGSQGVGYAYEAIKYGLQDLMVAGGAEELCATEAAVFDVLFATSTKNDTPAVTPRPFDKDRDGLVIGEGAGTLVLEEYEHAKARGARIYAELVSFATNSDGKHVTQPNQDTIELVMRRSLAEAGLEASAIGYVNAHATATTVGDIVESRATEKVFGKRIPLSSLKSYLGHTLGACGAIEAWATVQMMNSDWFAHTLNLKEVDPECAELDYINSAPRKIQAEYTMSNNFAFGGINTSMIFKRLG